MPDPNIHEVFLSYTIDADGNVTLQQPPTISVRQGHKIRFKRGTVPPSFRITVFFDEPQFFSHPHFDEGQGDIDVVTNLQARTTYRCGLRDAQGNLVPNSLTGPAKPGGDIDPDGGRIDG